MPGFVSRLKLAFAAALIAAGALPAAAATVTFDALPDEGAWMMAGRPDYVEAGVTVSGTPFRGRTAGVLPVLDFGTQWSSQATVTTGGLFDAWSFDFSGHATLPPGAAPVTNVFLKGLVGGTEVAAAGFALAGPASGTWIFGDAFKGIDTLVISVAYAFGTPSPGGCAPCTRLYIDKLTVAPVPLPAPALLLGGALGLGGAAALRRRRKLSPRA